jgi:hypothetical protein
MIVRLAALALFGLLLGACQHTAGSIAGGECKVFERPEFAVRGLRPYDQNWIDSQVEGGVGGCGWKRPAARPASLDAPVAQKKASAPIKKKSLAKRIKERVVAPFSKPVAPIIPTPEVPAFVEPAPAPTPPPEPRDPVDELLQPAAK